jgi:hypothetical protein
VLVIQTPLPSPGVYAPISRDGRVNYGYGVNGAMLMKRTALRGSQLLAGTRLLGRDDGGDCGCEREIGSIWGFLTLVAVGALGYALGASATSG